MCVRPFFCLTSSISGQRKKNSRNSITTNCILLIVSVFLFCFVFITVKLNADEGVCVVSFSENGESSAVKGICPQNLVKRLNCASVSSFWLLAVCIH